MRGRLWMLGLRGVIKVKGKAANCSCWSGRKVLARCEMSWLASGAIAKNRDRILGVRIDAVLRPRRSVCVDIVGIVVHLRSVRWLLALASTVSTRKILSGRALFATPLDQSSLTALSVFFRVSDTTRCCCGVGQARSKRSSLVGARNGS